MQQVIERPAHRQRPRLGIMERQEIVLHQPDEMRRHHDERQRGGDPGAGPGQAAAGGTVELSLLAGEGQARMVVRDTGIGLDPADAARIFDPFVRLDAARSRDAGGAGLGLALVRAIVDAHGGAIAVDSAPGAGSRFTIRLPLAPPA